MTDDHRCELIRDSNGEVIAHARVSPDLGDEGRRRLTSVIEAAVRLQAERDAADPEGAAERARRQARMRERGARWRGEAS